MRCEFFVQLFHAKTKKTPGLLLYHIFYHNKKLHEKYIQYNRYKIELNIEN